MSTNPKQQTADEWVERRREDRGSDELGWESKVVGRLNRRLHDLPSSDDQAQLGWEGAVLDVLRRRIEKGPT